MDRKPNTGWRFWLDVVGAAVVMALLLAAAILV